MPNPKHLEIAHQGTKAITAWRKANPGLPLDLHKADLSGADLRGADIGLADLVTADLQNANLSGANLSLAFLLAANLSGSNLSNTNLWMSHLGEANLSKANLSGADVSKANLVQADLRGADLRDANLLWTIFQETHLSDANLSKARMGDTVLASVDLRTVKGLEEVRHHGPSELAISTLYKSDGQIPEVFLRGCGVPEDLITYLPSLTGRAIEFYSCFISYTEADDAFSERLYNDLQARGIRCWRWREDAKWGRTMISEIDSAIRLHDKLIVILSAQSLASEPVIREIERALQKEARVKKEVLFPIRVDDVIFSWEHPLQADVKRKNIGDFRQWNDPAAYQASLKRLIEDLQSPSTSRS